LNQICLARRELPNVRQRLSWKQPRHGGHQVAPATLASRQRREAERGAGVGTASAVGERQPESTAALHRDSEPSLYLTDAECKRMASDELRFHCRCAGLHRWLTAREAAIFPSIEGDFFNTKGNH
jgi:hypothetical protein